MPKKTIQEFKEVFGAIKKPKRPKDVSSKDKGALEKAIDSDDKVALRQLSKVLYESEPAYFVDLLAYKLSKHFDDDEKRPLWLENVPDGAKNAAIKKIVPGDMQDGLTRRVFDKAKLKGNNRVVNLIKERDRDGVDELEAELARAPKKKEVSDALKDGSDTDAKAVGQMTLSWLTNNDIAEIAGDDPKRFFETVLVGFKDNENFVRRLGDADLRGKLQALDPEEWKKFAAHTPMLAALAKVEEDLEDDTTTGEAMDKMFAAVLDPKLMPLGYAATALDPNNIILSGPTEKSEGFRDEQREGKKKMGQMMPDDPATDCHHLLYITESMMKMVPGHKPKIQNRSCPNMLMTKPLTTIPGNGLLDRKFPGNVFDKTRKATGMVLFTGDEGKNSHTWLMVDGVPYDPVLGTKGDDVEGAVQEKFDWVIPQRLAKGEGSSYAVQVPGLAPANNAMGFSTGYVIVDKPADLADLLDEDEKRQAGLG